MPGGPIFNCYPGPFSNVRCNDGRHHVNVFFENRSRVDSKRCADLEARKRLDRVKIKVGKRKVHNLWLFSTKLWTYAVREKTLIYEL